MPNGILFVVIALVMILATIAVAIIFRTALRRAIIGIADFIVIICTITPIPLSIVLVVLDSPDKPLVLLGGVGLTLVFCLIAAAFLTLSEIAMNTRRMLAYYEPEQPQYDNRYETRR